MSSFVVSTSAFQHTRPSSQALGVHCEIAQKLGEQVMTPCVGAVVQGPELGVGSSGFYSYSYLLCEPCGSFSLAGWTMLPLGFSFTFDSLIFIESALAVRMRSLD